MIPETFERFETLRLDRTRVLVVEDEFYIADDLRRCLADAGAEVLGPAPTVAKAEAIIAGGGIDVAILDLNLHGDSALPIAERLSAAQVPFAIATGYGSAEIPEYLKIRPRCEKPFDPVEVVRIVAKLAAPVG